MKMYANTFSGLPAVQVDSEMKSFLRLLRDEAVSSYLEIGVARGDTFHEVVSRLPHQSRAVAVDYPEKKWGLTNSRVYLTEVVTDLIERGYSVKSFYGDSRDPEIIEAVIENGPYDCVFIDGDHSYNGVKSDWENYGRFARIAVFHDIADSMRPNRKGELIEVPIFWEEIKKQYKHLEFIESGSNMGIGVVFTYAHA